MHKNRNLIPIAYPCFEMLTPKSNQDYILYLNNRSNRFLEKLDSKILSKSLEVQIMRHLHKYSMYFVVTLLFRTISRRADRRLHRAIELSWEGGTFTILPSLCPRNSNDS